MNENPKKIPPPRLRLGMSEMLNDVESASPGLIGAMASDGFREAFRSEGGIPSTLTVEMGPNTDILRQPIDGEDPQTPLGYPYMLKLTFAHTPEAYENPPDAIVQGFIDRLQEAWNSQQRDHKPGALRTATLPNGDRTITIAHTSMGRLTHMANKVLKQYEVKTIDTRLMGVGADPTARQAPSR